MDGTLAGPAGPRSTAGEGLPASDPGGGVGRPGVGTAAGRGHVGRGEPAEGPSDERLPPPIRQMGDRGVVRTDGVKTAPEGYAVGGGEMPTLPAWPQ